jgi:cyclohexadienyl dehydratase
VPGPQFGKTNLSVFGHVTLSDPAQIPMDLARPESGPGSEPATGMEWITSRKRLASCVRCLSTDIEGTSIVRYSQRDHRARYGTLVAMLVLAGCAHAQQPALPSVPVENTLDAIHQRGALRVCSTGDYRPFTYHDSATGSWSGIDIDMGGDMAHQLGLPVQVVATTWATMLSDLTSRRCDIAMGGISVTAERAAKASYSDPYLADGKAPITRCADAARFQTLSQIDQPYVRVVVNPGGTNESYDRQTMKRASVVTFPDNNAIFNELLDGHADVILTDASETRWQAAQHPGQLCAVNPDRPFTVESKAYLLPQGENDFRRWVNRWLQSSMSNGTYRRFSQPWIG